MKKITCFLLMMCLSTFVNAQETTFEDIVEAEMKSAGQILSFNKNLNTANYDVISQELHLIVNPAVYFINGSVTTEFAALSTMSTITFDLADELNVSTVTHNGNNLLFTHNNNELVITLPSAMAAGQQNTVTVNYSGAPATGEDAFIISEHNGTPVLATLSEPYGARDWWPCKQDLNDKIEELDVYITAPSQYVSVSNGIEMGQTVTGANKTTHFHHSYPIPAYLVAIAVTNYSVFTQQAGTAPNTFPIVNYVYPEDLETAQDLLAVTPSVMALFEQLFEPYPFYTEKYGHAQWNVGGGMEHTTVSFMGGFGRELVSHELAHQWFGNKITCGSWKDIWLNEGFATYLSGLVVEHQDGINAFSTWRSAKIGNITSFPDGSVYLTDADTLNVSRIFSSRLSYNKGAMVLHMLRYKLGDANFYQGIKNYLADPALAYGYAHTDDLQSHLEAASGIDLDEFFNDWVYNQGYPSYNITVAHENFGQVKLTVNQSQSHPSVSFFEMPLTVRLLGAAGELYDVVLDNTFNGQEFVLPIWFGVTEAVFDPDNHIISANDITSLGSGEYNILGGISLYPNPTSGKLNITLPDNVVLQKAVIHNVLGQKVLETGAVASLDVSQLQQGVHFVTLDTDKGTTTLRFIKK